MALAADQAMPSKRTRSRLELLSRDVTTAAEPSATIVSPRRQNDKDDAARSKTILDAMASPAAKQPKLTTRPDFGSDDEIADGYGEDGGLSTKQAVTEHLKQSSKKKWDSYVSRHKLDVTSLFEDANLAHTSGRRMWRIEDFKPVEVAELDHGNFYEADCYIVLMSTRKYPDKLYHDDDDIPMEHQIYFWIGAESSTDKQASAAINSVHLRNYLQAETTSRREEQDDESPEFCLVFNNDLQYLEGGTDSGFFEIYIEHDPPRLYLLDRESTLIARAVPASMAQLHAKHVFLLTHDERQRYYLWIGQEAPRVTRTQAQLFVAKAVTRENKLEVVEVHQGDEPEGFTSLLAPAPSDFIPPPTLTSPLAGNLTKLHILSLVEGGRSLELPQLVAAGRTLSASLLSTDNVYIVDDFTDVYVWYGRKSSTLMRAAASRVARALVKAMPRPEHVRISLVKEGVESIVFKSKFADWNDLIAPDYRPADVQKVEQHVLQRLVQKHQMARATSSGSDSLPGSPTKLVRSASTNAVMDTDDVSELLAAARLFGGQATAASAMQASEIEVHDLFTPKAPLMDDLEAEEKELAFADEVDSIMAYKVVKGQPVKIEDDWLYHFFSKESYLYLVTYWHSPNDDKPDKPNDNDDGNADDDDSDSESEVMGVLVFFWQGRDAGKREWISFNFDGGRAAVEEKLFKQFDSKVEIQREYQQQESFQFMVVAGRRAVMHTGTRESMLASKEPSLYRMHQWCPSVLSKLVQERVEPRLLTSEDVCVLRVPFDDGNGGIVYVWLGAHSDTELQQWAMGMVKGSPEWSKGYSVQHVTQGSEPMNFFWSAMKVSDPSSVGHELTPLLSQARVFEAAAELGHFCITELTEHFCQDDLKDESCMIVDNGQKVYHWIGPYASDVVLKLAFFSAREYIRRLPPRRNLEPSNLIKVLAGREPFEFRCLFQGWQHHLHMAKELAKPLDFLGHVTDTDYQRSCYDVFIPGSAATIVTNLPSIREHDTDHSARSSMADRSHFDDNDDNDDNAYGEVAADEYVDIAGEAASPKQTSVANTTDFDGGDGKEDDDNDEYVDVDDIQAGPVDEYVDVAGEDGDADHSLGLNRSNIVTEEV
eukprot:TRINITY_DN12484_c2_g11_i1.p1 TRINITY_DN12484_c2_g11~~TRINITY_DN12484_c2_g11_i1.p1  ORF type:complete len:1280 (+),score=420.25 TRINITY_DN12484_c2_g11_i1:527-3841(+)